jgi:hypothetical protein
MSGCFACVNFPDSHIFCTEIGKPALIALHHFLDTHACSNCHSCSSQPGDGFQYGHISSYGDCWGMLFAEQQSFTIMSTMFSVTTWWPSRWFVCTCKLVQEVRIGFCSATNFCCSCCNCIRSICPRAWTMELLVPAFITCAYREWQQYNLSKLSPHSWPSQAIASSPHLVFRWSDSVTCWITLTPYDFLFSK